MNKVLVVDDEVEILDIVRHILTINNFTVETIADWQSISQTIKVFHPDLILLDINLSGADGRDICSDLKSSKETSFIPIILFSAQYNLLDLKACKPNAVIKKPFDIRDFVNTIQENLN